MRIKKSFRKMLAAAMAAGTFAVMPLAFAEVREYEGLGEYVMSDFETPDVAKQRAKARAEQNAMEQAGVYVESYTKVINAQVTHDEINVMTNGILKVKDVQYGKMTPTEDGKGILIRVTVKADIDTDDITKWLSQNRENVSNLVEQNKELQKAKAEQEKQIEELKKQVADAKSAQDKEKVQVKINAADQEFLSNQKADEGFKLLCDGDYVGAAVLLSQAIEINPKNALAYSRLGGAYAEMKDERKALENCNKAIELAPKDARAYCSRGLAYGKHGDYAKAIADFTKAIELDPKGAKSYNNRGLAYSELGDYAKAIADNTKAIELDPKYAAAYGNRGVAYERLGDYVKAIADFTKVVELNPKDALAYYNRGVAYQEMGNHAKANADFVMAKELGYEL